jgi:hypothetical protein
LVDGYFDPVSDLDEGNAPLFMPYCLRSQAIVPVIEPVSAPLPLIVKVNFLGSVTPGIVKSPSNRLGTGLYQLRRVKRNQRIALDVKQVFGLQLAVLHSTSGVHTGFLNLNVQNARR